MKCLTMLLAGMLAWVVCAADPVSEGLALPLSVSSKDTATGVVLFQNGTDVDGICYYKMTMKKGQKCTIWLEGKSDATVAIGDVYAQESWTMPGSTFSQVVYGNQTRWVFTGEDWSDDWSFSGDDDWGDDDWGEDWGEDWGSTTVPSSWTYYLVVQGPVGATAELHAMVGIQVPVGTPEKPLSITMKGSVQTNDLEFTGDNYFVTTQLKGGCRYYVGLTGGTEEHQLMFSGLPKLAIANYLPWDDMTGNNDSRVFIAEDDMTCVFGVNPNPAFTETDVANVKLFYRVDGTRTIAEHAKTATALAVGSTVSCTPGYKNNPATGAYDLIIDDALYSFKTEKNASYLIETEGAEVPLEMVVYDAKGNVLSSNTAKGDGSLDVRCALETAAAGTYYVGVCEDFNPIEDLGEEPTGIPVKLSIRKVIAPTGRDIALAEFVTPQPVAPGASTLTAAAVAGPVALDGTTWYRVFKFEGRKGMTYGVAASQNAEDKESTGLRFEIFYLSGKAEKLVADFSVSTNSNKDRTFVSEQNVTYYVRISVLDGIGCDFRPFCVHVTGLPADGGIAGLLKVLAGGTDAATWSLADEKGKAESVKYANGATILLPPGTYAVAYSSVKGYSTPAMVKNVIVAAGELTSVSDSFYSDTYDHKDDVETGATALMIKATETAVSRTLWPDDPADYFSFQGKDGCYFTFALRDVAGDAQFSIVNANGFALDGLTRIDKLLLPKTSSKYYLIVKHGTAEKTGGAYTLSALSATAGTIKFAKADVSAKDTATSVKLTVNRTAKEGMVRVRYTTADGTAFAGEHYVAQEGVLEWANNDNKAKTIEIKLVPKMIAAYNGGDREFYVTLEDAEGEYPADIATPKATVTVTESSKTSVTVESVYAKKAPKLATVKTEEGALRGGTFFGIVKAAESSLTNGFPELASVTLTVTAKGGVDDTSKDSLSAKVALGGKIYTFKTAKGEAIWDVETASEKTKTLMLETTVNKVKYVNTLKLEVFDGATTNATAWLDALAKATLTMNVPDANNKGVQEGVVYSGDLYRQNAKIQAYLNVVTNFTGYYTVALANPNGNEKVAPAGHGYLTLTVDNKGTAKVAGLLADSTKVSLSVTASAVYETEGGYEMLLPLYLAKSPYCFGGEIVLRRQKIVAKKPDGEAVNPDGKDFDVVVGTKESVLIWNNDNGKLTYEGTEGWSLALSPIGGWYDTVFNLQNYYKGYALSVDTAEISEFPTEALAEGYVYVSTEANDPNGYPVELQGDAMATAKRTYAKDAGNAKLYDLDASVNPFNVQLKLARATGVVTGSFSLWSFNELQLKQKEITGIKHNGIVLLQRDAAATELSADVLTAGFFNQTVKVSREADYNAKTKKYATRSWTLSKPFNITAAGAAD